MTQEAKDSTNTGSKLQWSRKTDEGGTRVKDWSSTWPKGKMIYNKRKRLKEVNIYILRKHKTGLDAKVGCIAFMDTWRIFGRRVQNMKEYHHWAWFWIQRIKQYQNYILTEKLTRYQVSKQQVDHEWQYGKHSCGTVCTIYGTQEKHIWLQKCIQLQIYVYKYIYIYLFHTPCNSINL